MSLAEDKRIIRNTILQKAETQLNLTHKDYVLLWDLPEFLIYIIFLLEILTLHISLPIFFIVSFLLMVGRMEEDTRESWTYERIEFTSVGLNPTPSCLPLFQHTYHNKRNNVV